MPYFSTLESLLAIRSHGQSPPTPTHKQREASQCSVRLERTLSKRVFRYVDCWADVANKIDTDA